MGVYDETTRSITVRGAGSPGAEPAGLWYPAACDGNRVSGPVGHHHSRGHGSFMPGIWFSFNSPSTGAAIVSHSHSCNARSMSSVRLSASIRSVAARSCARMAAGTGSLSTASWAT